MRRGKRRETKLFVCKVCHTGVLEWPLPASAFLEPELRLFVPATSGMSRPNVEVEAVEGGFRIGQHSGACRRDAWVITRARLDELAGSNPRRARIPF